MISQDKKNAHKSQSHQDNYQYARAKEAKATTLITSHINPDFDALASMVAAYKLYPHAILLTPSGNNQSMNKFFMLESVSTYPFINAKDCDFSTITKLVLVDTHQADRVPHLTPLLKNMRDGQDIEVHVWDHHPASQNDIACKEENKHIESWGSTVSILVHEMQKQGITLHTDEATILGLGLYDDTGSFNFTSTTSHDFYAASWLLMQGMDIEAVASAVRYSLNAEQISALNMLLESATTHIISGTSIVFAQISLDDYLPDFATLVQNMMEMEDIDVIFVLARMADKVQLVARSTLPHINVQHVCVALGGGGHSYAASASIKNKTLEEVRDAIFRQISLTMNHAVSVAKLMSSPAIGIEKHRSMQYAEEVMNRFGLKAVPIFETNSRHCVGYLEYQTATRAMAHKLGYVGISDYMQRTFRTLAPHACLQEVMDIIIEHRQRIIPIAPTPSDDVIGVVTRTDLINAIVDESARKPDPLVSQRRKTRRIQHLMRERLPHNVYALLEHAGKIGDRLGLSVYTVGGFVRDLLLNRPNLDIDLVVEGDAIAFAKIFAKELQGRVREHTAFKTALIIYNENKGIKKKSNASFKEVHAEQRIDVATARLEYYAYPAALPSVELSSIKMDLFRRDFTINALALQLNSKHFGTLVDFFHAQQDIKDGVMRVLHSLSFVEDPTRMMRAVRFEQRYGFRLGQQSLRLIKNALELKLMEKLSGARIFHEFRIMTEENVAVACFRRMDELTMLGTIHKKFTLNPQKNAILERMQDALIWYRMLYRKESPELWLCYLLCLSHDANDEECYDIATRMALNPAQKKLFLQSHEQVACNALFKRHTSHEALVHMAPSALCTLLSPLGLEGILYAMAITDNETLREKSSYYINELQHVRADINGNDLRAMGLASGPLYTQILQRILHAKLDGEAPSRAVQLSMARHLMEEAEKKAKST